MSDGFSEAMRGTYFRSNKYLHRSGRTTPKFITELKDNEIFIFGTNLKGIHGKGAAKQALIWGAKWGQAKGLQGKTYGIPTKDEYIKTLPIRQIKKYVDEFIEFAKNNTDKTFLVTPIGCGLAGLKPKDIAPLFGEAKYIDNIHLPEIFWKYLK